MFSNPSQRDLRGSHDESVLIGVQAVKQLHLHTIGPKNWLQTTKKSFVLLPEANLVASQVIPEMGLEEVGISGGKFFAVEDDRIKIYLVQEASLHAAQGKVGVFPIGKEIGVKRADGTNKICAYEQCGP